MKELMIDASTKLAFMLEKRDADPVAYKRFIQSYAFMFCREWKR